MIQQAWSIGVRHNALYGYALISHHLMRVWTICWTNDGGSGGSRPQFRIQHTVRKDLDRTGNGGYAMWVDGSIPNDNSNPPVLTSRTVDITMLTQPSLNTALVLTLITLIVISSLLIFINANGTTDSAVVFSGRLRLAACCSRS